MYDIIPTYLLPAMAILGVIIVVIQMIDFQDKYLKSEKTNQDLNEKYEDLKNDNQTLKEKYEYTINGLLFAIFKINEPLDNSGEYFTHLYELTHRVQNKEISIVIHNAIDEYNERHNKRNKSIFEKQIEDQNDYFLEEKING